MKNTLAPFDLERALAGDPVVTRDGREVTEVVYLKTLHHRLPVIVVIDGDKYTATTKGQIYPTSESPADLFMAPKPVERFINIYTDGVGGANNSLQAAIGLAVGLPISICKISILNGRVVSAETVHEY